jgi:hypothetical protein
MEVFIVRGMKSFVLIQIASVESKGVIESGAGALALCNLVDTVAEN